MRELLIVAALPFAVVACDPGEGGPEDADVQADASRDADGPGDADGDGDTDGSPDGGGGDGDVDEGGIVDVDSGLHERPANATCLAGARPAASDATLSLTRAHPSLPRFSQPILALQIPGDGSQWYVVERAGRVLRFVDDPLASEATVVVDISGVVDSTPGEGGLIGLAFHPEFSTNGTVVLSYTVQVEGTLTSRISTMESADGGLTLDPSSEAVVLEVAQPYGNHNGGHVAFGPGGLLFVGLGDGGSGGDPLGSGQDTSTLLGAILRIDLDGGVPYAVPGDNPFADGALGRPEIFAYGLRNPWRFSFDRATGDLWAGDVGQSALEEVDLVRLGGNYGWNIMEGTSCYGGGSCDGAGLELPLAEYGRTEGRSITGGVVYRGGAVPSLAGTYLYADYVTGRLWGLFEDSIAGDLVPRVLLDTAMNVSSFAEDVAGEVYLLDYGRGTLHRIEGDGGTPATGPAELLSETGCFDPADPRLPAPGLVPYGVQMQLWSDGADKDRWLALPDGAAIDVAEGGHLDLPVGTVLVKVFRFGDVLVETRLLMRHDDGLWAGYSYAWNAEQTDATLLAAGERRLFDGHGWLFPSRAQCAQCHTAAAGRSLGLEVAQQNGPFIYSGGLRANQLATFDHIGLLASPLPASPAALPRLPTIDEEAPAEDRARAYLHSNCSFCHRPGAPGRGDLDLRYDTPLSETRLCGEAPAEGDLGIDGARLIAPGEPATSVLLQRMLALDVDRMPPLSSEVVDLEGTDLVEAWIEGLSECP